MKMRERDGRQFLHTRRMRVLDENIRKDRGYKIEKGDLLRNVKNGILNTVTHVQRGLRRGLSLLAHIRGKKIWLALRRKRGD